MTKTHERTKDYLTQLLKAYWFAPPVALWRAVELRTAAEETYERPLLDLGCGDGLIGRILFGTPGTVDVGFDPWLGQLERARQSGVYRHVDLADGHHLPYPAGTFATAFSNSVLEHIPDVAPVVRETGRVLKPGGHFIFTVPSDCFRTLLDGYVRRAGAGDVAGAEAYAASVDRWLAHHHYHTPEQWSAILADAGMALTKARYYIPEAVERLWDRMNARFGVNRQRSLWGILASPRLRPLGYQALLSRLLVGHLGRRWHAYYEMDVPPDEKGGGLLIVAKKEGKGGNSRRAQ
ncbi:MAG TPA: class I SAM-dependent methyltransferase [Chloroflexi bacterium]|nr:class I SAM-dependent methyltransferase [Chloroflexota bacterium]